MKEYTALTYVKDSAGHLITPGEIFDADYSDTQEAWLISAGAIRSGAETAFREIAEVRDADDAVDNEQADETEAKDAPETETETTDETMTIDVMEGIVTKPRARRTKA